MTILDKVQDTFSNFRSGEMLSRSEIINLVHAKYGVNKGSIIPSDYCYNLVNKDKLSNRTRLDFNLFKWIDSKTYVYIGKDQKYTGPIFHKNDLKYEQVGSEAKRTESELQSGRTGFRNAEEEASERR